MPRVLDLVEDVVLLTWAVMGHKGPPQATGRAPFHKATVPARLSRGVWVAGQSSSQSGCLGFVPQLIASKSQTLGLGPPFLQQKWCKHQTGPF